MKKNIVYIVLSLSVLLNILYFKYDTFDYIWPKVESKYFPIETIKGKTQDVEKSIVDASMNMLNNDPLMVWTEQKGLTQTILSRKHITSTNEFRLHNYPRAYLYYGLSEYLTSNNRHEELLELKQSFDRLYDLENINDIKINRIDQVPFGLTALNLYDHFKEDKYLEFSRVLYEFVINLIEEDGIISYRKEQRTVLNDMLGMVVPFLIKYDRYVGNENVHPLVKDQLQYFIHYGIDPLTHIPAHAINRNTKAKVGSINWGRGIGWYFISLSQYNKATGEFQKEIDTIASTLNSLRNSENLWSQFPGSSDKFDASTTTMFLYSMSILDKVDLSKDKLFEMLQDYISVDGIILETSGDTYAVNNYSNSFGQSELSQGVLLLLLADLK